MGAMLDDDRWVSRLQPSSKTQVIVRLGGLDHLFDCPAGSNLLEAALAAGVMVPYSCREGHCGTCITRLVDGQVSANAGSALSRRDRLQRRILACQSCPTSASVTLDYDA